MSVTLKKTSSEHEDVSFLNSLYFMPLKELLAMDETLMKGFILKTEVFHHWLRGIHTLAQELKKKGN